MLSLRCNNPQRNDLTFGGLMTATADATQEEIAQIIAKNDVVLFMKGKRGFPQCGFSATVMGILDDMIDDYETVNVLADPEIRSGIKTYSDWPTIPQLYIRGEFVGGCDITKQLFGSGELHKMLGVEMEEVEAPAITVTEAAIKTLTEAAERDGQAPSVRIQISRHFQYGMQFSPQQDGDLVVDCGGIAMLFDRGSAKRANGMTIDFVADEGGFKIDNPNEPAAVQQIDAATLRAAMDADDALRLYDVRSIAERETAAIAGATLFDAAAREEALGLDKDTPLYFHCHHGGRSQAAAQEFIAKGFTKVFNLAGGIDGWSRDVDQDVPRY